MSFKNPEFFYLLLLIIPMIAWYIWQRKRLGASIQFSSTMGFSRIPKTWKYYFRHSVFVLQMLSLSMLVVALARPQSSNSSSTVTTKGIDIVIALDISSSMLAMDFRPNRIEAAKDVAIQFVSGRTNDRIGLVVFAGESFTQCPLTTDRATVINLFKGLESGMIEDGTAIGNGLATAVSRLKESDAISKVVILLTDGENNRGEIAPVTAAELAKTFGIRVYTVGVGTIGMAPYPMQTPFGVQVRDVEVNIDEVTLEKIASTTDGKYFRATNNNKLAEIYQEIDKLEKSKIDVKEFRKEQEEYLNYALMGALLLILSMILKVTVFRNIP
ncbi:MAG: VWA domain-containing protein [Verrucomicrobia bacterium]|nr:VWA domain-containing protein [Prolixibacteraceae bacterium]